MDQKTSWVDARTTLIEDEEEHTSPEQMQEPHTVTVHTQSFACMPA